MQSSSAAKDEGGIIRRGLTLVQSAFAEDITGPFATELRSAQQNIILSRTLVLVWISVVVMPTTIWSYVFFTDPASLRAAVTVVSAAIVAVFALRSAVQRGLFDRHYHLSMLLLVGGVFGPTGTATVEITKGGGGDFFFAFFLIFFAFTALFPASVRWILATSVLLICEWAAGHLLGGGTLSDQRFSENLIYFLELTFIGVVLNRVVTRLFLSERAAQEQLRRAQSQQLRGAHMVSNAIQRTQGVDSTLEGMAKALREELPLIGAVSVQLNYDAISGPTSKRSASGEAPNWASLERSVIAGNQPVGTLVVWAAREEQNEELAEVIDFLMPTLSMAVENALRFEEVVGYRDELEQRVHERTEELSVAKDRLSTSLRDLQAAEATRDRIFANLNHELRTPLSIMRLATEEIGALAEERALTVVQRPLEMIDRNVSRLLNLVNGLLLLASHDEGMLELSTEHLDLHSLVAESTLAWAPLCNEHDIELICRDLAPARTWVDEHAMDRVLGNLLSNAIKYTPPGGRIRVTLEATKRTCVLSVIDTGVGMPAAFVDDAFERFSLGPRPVHSLLGRSGIGLALVRELVQAHGGRVELESAEGEGTTVTVTLPLQAGSISTQVRQNPEIPRAMAQASTASPKAPTAIQSWGAKTTILIAEDESELRESMARALGRHYRVITASNGAEALAMAQTHLPDLLVTDIEMPEMDGLELTRSFAELSMGRAAPTLIVTARSSLDKRMEGFDAGAVDYISKPFHQSELIARVEAQLRIRELLLKLVETEKLAAIGFLGAGMAHEFRNPANVILGAIDGLKGLMPAELIEPSTRGGRLFGALGRSSQRLRDMCDAILELESPESSSSEPCDIHELLESAISPARDFTGTLSIHCKQGLQAPLARVLIIQLLHCLIDNSVKACGGEGEIIVAAEADASDLVLTVSDSGPGIPPELRERVFAPFFTTAGVGEGTGLGLALARRMAHELGATLQALHCEVGCTMELRIPHEEESSTPAPDANP